MSAFRQAASLLPLKLCGELLVLPADLRESAEEIRLRAGYPLSILTGGGEVSVADGYILTPEDIAAMLEKATCASLHSVENELLHGFITVDGGVRIGVCGSGVVKNGHLSGLKNLSSAAIRIPHELCGIASESCAAINADGLKSVLVLSPPGGGKTSYLRDYIRCVSEMGCRIGVADERGELGGIVPLGAHTDVMSRVEKSLAAAMLLKTMNPQLIAMDEISLREDIRAVYTASGCGVKLLASVHAENVAGLRRKKLFHELLNARIFDCTVVIHNRDGRRSYEVGALP